MSRALSLLFGLLLPAAALAQEIEEHGPQHIPWAKLSFTIINFSLFLYILRRAAWPAVRNFVHERRARVEQALAQADRARSDAEALRAEWQRRLEHLSAELATMLEQARADIAVERDQILAAAQRTAESIRRDAQRTAENEIRSAHDALRAEVAAQALAIAERLAPQRLSGADQQRFVAEFVDQVNE
jgi:F-type H+-transporting ATPase subunit b